MLRRQVRYPCEGNIHLKPAAPDFIQTTGANSREKSSPLFHWPGIRFPEKTLKACLKKRLNVVPNCG
jgi:hypothetical protein